MSQTDASSPNPIGDAPLAPEPEINEIVSPARTAPSGQPVSGAENARPPALGASASPPPGGAEEKKSAAAPSAKSADQPHHDTAAEKAMRLAAGLLTHSETKKEKGGGEKEPKASAEMEKYFEHLRTRMEKALDMANAARSRGLDPERYVEINPAADVAARVEGLVGPPGVAALIHKWEESGKSRELVAYEVLLAICRGELIKGDRDALIDQGVRTAVSILTEGVLVAPTEGIAHIRVKKNPDGSDYLAIYFAGPIRSAGGTVAALSVVMADVARRHFKLGDYRPLDDEVERYVEEINLYNDRCAHLQYKPSDDDIRKIVRACPVCVEGEPTEEMEVSVKRDLARVETNRVRGGIALVICEGIAQKAAKVLKYTSKIGLDWTYLESMTKGVKKSMGSFELKGDPRFMDELVAGRPVFSFPLKPGGFRIRYGRTRASGIAGKAIHPATMYILDSFPAIGTQLKIERPGKGAVVSPCDAVLGPVVKLQDGSVVEVTSSKQAQEIVAQVVEILFLGDLLVPVGDFLKANHPLVPSGMVEEWWVQLAAAKGLKYKIEQVPPAPEAFKLSHEHGLPLHPRYIYFWQDITAEQMRDLAEWLVHGKLEYEWFHLKGMSVESAPAKRVLELLCIPHQVLGARIYIAGDTAYALLTTLALLDEAKHALTPEKFRKNFDPARSAQENANSLSGVNILPKAPVYVGTRMGRPEKSKERKMAPPTHVLFPLGRLNKSRQVVRTYDKARGDEKKEGRGMEVDVARLRCRTCKTFSLSITCPACGGDCERQRVCSNCGVQTNREECPTCHGKTRWWERRNIDLVKRVEEAKRRLNWSALPEIKGVQGLISESKIPEALEKGFLRAKHGVTVFRDATCRHDSTNVTLTHFTPREVRVSIDKLKTLGYTHDLEGKPLHSPDQVLALKVQDVIVSDDGAQFFFKVANYIDEMLVTLYQMRPYYQLNKPEDLVGHLAVGLSPHTSAGCLCRIVGFTRAHVGYAHPYFHCAKRRNTDGDEDSLMLLADALINFSRRFIPATRGGTMDAPLVLTTRLDPTEVDDEVHSMEACESYSLEFYELAARFASPSEANVPLVKNLLGKAGQYESLGYTHAVKSIDEGPLMTSYISLEKSMVAKVKVEFALEDKLRAVDPADVANRVLLSHFLPDMYGNLRSFSRQTFRCVDCNAKFRRVPLVGHCTKCNGKLILTIYKGGIEKYLKPSLELVERYHLPAYMKQRIELIRKDIDSIFTDEKSVQKGLADYM
ncbi:DNA polymerase II large subunit [uncultured archaeon]|nr:DNA polymerase II large subunit [uncultured archaeon]